MREEIRKITVTPVEPVKQLHANKNELGQSNDAIVSNTVHPRQMEICDDLLLTTLESLDEPAEELRINLNEISKLEKYVHFEFFDGRPSKTADRYLKIRNHILTSWQNNKPTYVGKTSVRNGLKQCGDVNCISRIHSLLEQIGAINFGCHGEHFNFIRPLSKLVESFKVVKVSSKVSAAVIEQRTLERNNRIKKVHPFLTVGHIFY